MDYLDWNREGLFDIFYYYILYWVYFCFCDVIRGKKDYIVLEKEIIKNVGLVNVMYEKKRLCCFYVLFFVLLFMLGELVNFF